MASVVEEEAVWMPWKVIEQGCFVSDHTPSHAAVRGLCLLTLKPLIYAGNVAETDLADDGASNEHVQARLWRRNYVFPS